MLVVWGRRRHTCGSHPLHATACGRGRPAASSQAPWGQQSVPVPVKVRAGASVEARGKDMVAVWVPVKARAAVRPCAREQSQRCEEVPGKGIAVVCLVAKAFGGLGVVVSEGALRIPAPLPAGYPCHLAGEVPVPF